LIYFTWAADPPEFEEAQRTDGPALRPQGFRAGSGGPAIDYDIHANWKLVLGE